MKLEKLSQTFPMMEPSWVPHHLAGKIQDVCLGHPHLSAASFLWLIDSSARSRCLGKGVNR